MDERLPPSEPPPSAADLIDWFPTWNADARTLFLGIYHSLIVGIALKLRVRPQDAPDVAQNTVLRLRELAHKYDPNLPLFPWVQSITRYVILEMRRQGSTRIRSAATLEIEPAGNDPEFDRIWQQELLDRTKAWLITRVGESKMAPETVALGLPALFDEATVEELCKRFGVAPSAVHTSKSRLRKLVADLGEDLL